MRIRVLSVAIILLAIYVAFGDTILRSQFASADGMIDGVITTVGHAVRGVAGAVGRTLAWG